MIVMRNELSVKKMHELQISAFKTGNQLHNSKSNLLIRNFSNGKISCQIKYQRN